MVNVVGFATLLLASLLCAAPVAAQPCGEVTGEAEIDGVMQPISEIACLQPDGTWQIVQSQNDANYYGPSYWSGPGWLGGVVVVSGVLVFVDRFHRFHRFSHPHIVFHRKFNTVRGGWGGPHPSGSSQRMWNGMGAGGRRW